MLHSTAVLVGGFGFALVWLPESERYVFVRKWILWAVIIGSTLFGIWTLLLGGMLPVMVQDGEFTIIAIVMNLLSGVLFLAAGVRFLLDFQRSMKSEAYLFSCMALLFGLASLMFTYSELWDDGWWFWHALRLSAYLLVMGFVIHRYLQTVLSLRAEVTEHAKTEEKLKHLYGVLLTIRRINQIIVDIGDEAELLKKACEILVDGRNYKIAWIGSTSEGSYDVLPVAQAGFEEGYLSSVKITWDDSEYGDGPTGMAIKARRPSVMRDIPNDERYRPWREQALKRGYLSSAALPLLVDNKVIGALNVYSGKPDAFDDAEIDMLAELAGDISLGIQKIRQHEALRKSEELFRLMVEEVKDYAILMLDTEGRVVTWNEGAERIKGYVEQEIIGQHMSRFYTNDDIKQGKPSSLLKRAEAEGWIEDEGWRVRKDGSRFWANVAITAIRDDTGQLMGYSKVTRDLTERKQAEEEIRLSEEKFSDAFGASPVGLTITRIADGKFIEANESFCQMFEFDRDEVIGHTSTELNMWSPQERAKLIERQRESGGLQNYDLAALSKSGKVVNVLFSSKMLAIEGQACLLTTMIDITERKRAGERLAHLSTVLMAVRNVNQLITKEKQRDHLIQRACDLLVEKRSYEKAWILLLDENRNFVSAAGAGLEGSTST